LARLARTVQYKVHKVKLAKQAAQVFRVSKVPKEASGHKACREFKELMVNPLREHRVLMEFKVFKARRAMSEHRVVWELLGQTVP
jgi:hypothetical protein